jgi:hypothetical protein
VLLLSPIYEELVLPQQHLQSGIDDVIRGAVDKRGYFSTTSATGSSTSYSRLTCCGGLLMIDMCFLLFSSCSYPDTGKTLRKQSTTLFAGLERPHDSFGQPKAHKNGVAPAHPSVLPASILSAAPCATFRLPTTSVHPKGERNGERADAHGLSPGKCRRRGFAPATAVSTPPAAPAH